MGSGKESPSVGGVVREVCAGAFVEAPEGRCASVELVFWRETLGGARHPEVQRFWGIFFSGSVCVTEEV